MQERSIQICWPSIKSRILLSLINWLNFIFMQKPDLLKSRLDQAKAKTRQKTAGPGVPGRRLDGIVASVLVLLGVAAISGVQQLMAFMPQRLF